jgi:peptidyl-prolyl cis-trans isomerase D
MLRGMRTASRNWLGKVVMAAVMGLLIVSFAIWGIGDIFKGFGRSTVAKIGSTEITVDQFRQIYNDRLQQLGRRFGRPITSEQARLLGFDRQILAQLVAEAALDERSRQLRLGLSDAEVAKRIQSEAIFQGPTGRFDHDRFLALIRQAGYTEPRYVSEQRRISGRRQIVEAIGGGLTVPKASIEAQNRYENEQRSIEYVVLDKAQAGEISAPTPEVLAKYFDERKALFRAPEYRKISLLVLTPAEEARWIEISDADVKKAYEDRKARYVTPERRHVKQIPFLSAEAARAAAERVAKGEVTFAALATELGRTEKDIDLGVVTKTVMADKVVADAAFALKQGDVSEPVQGRFGTVLLQVDKIDPEQVRSYEDVAPELKRELATERARTEINNRRDKIEDARAGGSTLPELAKNLGLTARTIDAIDRQGRAPDGVAVPGLPQGVDVVAAAFASDVGVESDPLEIGRGNGFVWYEVSEIIPSRERKLEEVKDEVEKRWRDDEVAARLRTKANEMVDKLKAGTTLAELAEASKLKIETATKFKRGLPVEGLSTRAVDEVFRTPKGAPGTAEGERPGERIVFRVTDVIEPPFDPASADAKRISEALRRSFSDELVAQYVGRLENELGTSISEAAVRQAIGGSTN